MNILILDDDEILIGDPPDYFVEGSLNYKDANITQVGTPNDFWDAYPLKKWDEIWLDHDLGLTYLSGRDVTIEITRLANEGVVFKETFKIISMNPPAAKAMLQDIAAYTPAPVTWSPIMGLSSYGITRGNRLHVPVLTHNPKGI